MSCEKSVSPTVPRAETKEKEEETWVTLVNPFLMHLGLSNCNRQHRLTAGFDFIGIDNDLWS